MTNNVLRTLPLFAGLADPDLARLSDMTEEMAVQAGQVLMEEGSPGDALYIAIEGRYEVSKRSGERDIVIAGCGPGDIMGEISLLAGAPRTATVRALQDGRLMKVSREAFEQLISRRPKAAMAVVRTVTERMRNMELMLRQSEKMAALGTLSAGLAHELNNPAAAVRRSSELLREGLAVWLRAAAALDSSGLSEAQRHIVDELRADFPRRAGTAEAAEGTGRTTTARLDPLARNDLEGALQEWLEEEGVDEAWELAPALVALGWSPDELAALAESFEPRQQGPLLAWLAAGSAVYSLLDEVHQGAERISEIVRAVKSYSYLDQAPVQLVDVHEGIENTLVILRHKLKQGVTIRRQYASNLPRIEAFASELNQVWTNIIDNAVDAMGGKGEIHIRTFPEDGRVVVEISDNGPGIPSEIQPRLFEAFFTTKPPGVGTGLGLNIVWNVVVHQHRGDVKVKSRPGETTFRVALPVRARAEGRAQETEGSERERNAIPAGPDEPGR